jgi:Domain of unknown function (DUF5615)
MVSLYLDEDSMDRELVTALRARGMDVLTATEADMIEQADSEHLAYATTQRRVLFSFNRGDFYRLHTSYLTEDRTHAGMILALQQRYSIGVLMRQILELPKTHSAEAMQNQAVFLKDGSG